MEDILATMGEIGSIGTAIATIALVLLFLKTIMQLEETVKVSKIQTNYRFRPGLAHLTAFNSCLLLMGATNLPLQ